MRDELDLSYSVGGLHVAAFAAGSMAAGVLSAPVEAAIGRRGLLWASAALMGAGTVGLVAGHTGAMTIGSVLVMGLGGGLLLVTVQAVLSDQHGDLRAIALTEANVSASVGYVILIDALSVTAALHLGWRTALLASLVVPLLRWCTTASSPSRPHRPRSPQQAASRDPSGSRPGCSCAPRPRSGAPPAGGQLRRGGDRRLGGSRGLDDDRLLRRRPGRILGSRLARRIDPARLLATALVVALVVGTVGFAVLWPATTAPLAVVGLALLGVGSGSGSGNLFPMGISLAVSLAPGRAVLAGGRAVTATSFAALLAPLTVGAVADATSLKAALLLMPVTFALAGSGLVVVARVSPAARSPS